MSATWCARILSGSRIGHVDLNDLMVSSEMKPTQTSLFYKLACVSVRPYTSSSVTCAFHVSSMRLVCADRQFHLRSIDALLTFVNDSAFHMRSLSVAFALIVSYLCASCTFLTLGIRHVF